MPLDDIRHIFFDLDHTLWDFERNSAETLGELFGELDLAGAGIPDPQTFIATYSLKNDLCWQLYRENKLDKETLRTERFVMAFREFGVENNTLADTLSEAYLERSPYKTGLFPDTLDVLDYLAGKYTLHIITNGFEEVQHIKIRQSGLENYFRLVTTSERAGYRKPDTRIFQYALATADAHTYDSLMIGDDLQADVIGAQQAGLRAILFRPDTVAPLPENQTVIHRLGELRNLL